MTDEQTAAAMAEVTDETTVGTTAGMTAVSSAMTMAGHWDDLTVVMTA